MVDEQRDVRTAGLPVVAVPAGLADHRDRDLHPRTGDEAAVDRLLDAEVGPARVADGGDSDVEGLAEVVGEYVVEVEIAASG